MTSTTVWRDRLIIASTIAALPIGIALSGGNLPVQMPAIAAQSNATQPQSNATLDAIMNQVRSREGKTVWELGCPKSYATRGGNGSVCCANQVSAALKAAGVDIAGSDAVVTVVQQLRDLGWQQVPIDQAPPGAVIFSNKWGKAIVKNPGQHIEIATSFGAKTSAGSWGAKFTSHADYVTGSHRQWMQRGGDFGGALVPPSN